ERQCCEEASWENLYQESLTDFLTRHRSIAPIDRFKKLCFDHLVVRGPPTPHLAKVCLGPLMCLQPQHCDLGGDAMKHLVDPFDSINFLGIVDRCVGPYATDGNG